MAENKIINPLKMTATQKGGTGKNDGKSVVTFHVPVDDVRMQGHAIPMGVDAEMYSKKYLQMLEELGVDNQADEKQKVQIVKKGDYKKISENAVANFELKPLVKIRYVDRYGRNDAKKEKVHFEVYIEGCFQQKMEILVCEIDKIVKKITRKFSTAVVDYGVKNVEKVIETDFRMATRFIPVRLVLWEHGWQNVDGKKVFVHDAMLPEKNIGLSTNMVLPFYRDFSVDTAGKVYFKALEMHREKSKICVMVLYSLLGILYKVFEEAGYPPRFLLFVNGKTGSMKTTISKILYTQLTDMEHRNMPRRIDADTLNSLERAIVLTARDNVILIDDFSPAKTPQKKADLQNRLEHVIRMIGDGATKSRSNINLEDVHGEGVKGMVVVTGEIRGKGLSSNLRCFYCEVDRKDADLDVISWFQHNEYAYTSMLKCFADFVGVNWEKCKEIIIRGFPMERADMANVLTERRLIDSAVCLRVTADIVHAFLEWCGMDAFMIEEHVNFCKFAILQMACQNESLAKGENFGETFLKAVSVLMDSKKIKLYQGKIEHEHMAEFDGFEDDTFFYFMPEITFSKVMQFLAQMKQFFPLDLKELVASLLEDGIIKTYSNGAGKKTNLARISIGNNKKSNFLKIKKDVFESVVEGSFYADGKGGKVDE